MEQLLEGAVIDRDLLQRAQALTGGDQLREKAESFARTFTDHGDRR